MKRVSILWALGLVCAWAIDIPRIGFACDAQGRLTVINGIAGNFIDGGAAAQDPTVAFAWSGTFGLRKTASSLEVWNASANVAATFNADEGDAVIGLNGPAQSGLIFVKSTSELFHVQANQSQWRMEKVPVNLSNPEEEVLALVSSRDSVTIALRRSGDLFLATFDLNSGNRIAEQPLAQKASQLQFLDDGSLAGADGSTLWISRPDGSTWNTDIGAPLTGLARMGAEWLQVRTDGQQQYALSLRAEPALFALPQAVTQ